MLLHAPAWFFISLPLLLPPLPLEEHGDKLPQVELGPEALEEEYLGVLVTLPEHEIAQPFYPTRSNKYVEGRASNGVHVAI